MRAVKILANIHSIGWLPRDVRSFAHLILYSRNFQTCLFKCPPLAKKSNYNVIQQEQKAERQKEYTH
ncbi:2517_t:CDS:2 [Entrophospora sp. SA101]|nr:2517_t:CDS:2 [Entrophospora sp. SA101]